MNGHRLRIALDERLGFVSKADFSRRPVSLTSVFFESRRDSTTVLRQSLAPSGGEQQADQFDVIADAHLLEHPRAMLGTGLNADLELAGNLLH